METADALDHAIYILERERAKSLALMQVDTSNFETRRMPELPVEGQAAGAGGMVQAQAAALNSWPRARPQLCGVPFEVMRALCGANAGMRRRR